MLRDEGEQIARWANFFAWIFFRLPWFANASLSQLFLTLLPVSGVIFGLTGFAHMGFRNPIWA